MRRAASRRCGLRWHSSRAAFVEEYRTECKPVTASLQKPAARHFPDFPLCLLLVLFVLCFSHNPRGCCYIVPCSTERIRTRTDCPWHSPRIQALLSCLVSEEIYPSVPGQNTLNVFIHVHTITSDCVAPCQCVRRTHPSLSPRWLSSLTHKHTPTRCIYNFLHTLKHLRRMLQHRFCSPPMWQCLPSNERSLFQSSCRQGVWPTSQVFRVPYMTGGPSRPHRWTGCKHRPHPINT